MPTTPLITPSASSPRYAPHELRSPAVHHVLVWASAPDAEDLRFAASLRAQVPGQHTVLGETKSPDEDASTVGQRLAESLQKASTGTHLYLSGTEEQIWGLVQTASNAGVHTEEMSLYRHCAGSRPVYCVHCGCRQQMPVQGKHACSQCRLVLEVREHFSHRQAAYLGVGSDAKRPPAQHQALVGQEQ